MDRELPYVFPPRCSVAADCGWCRRCHGGWCAASGCGDGALGPGEECDDGNEVDTDGCELDCTRTEVLDLEVTTMSCALFSAGTVKCWGGNSEIGLEPGALPADPAAVRPLDFGTEQRVAQISPGRGYLCVLFEGGRARCWGSNQFGQLGIGTTDHHGDDPEETPDALPDLPFDDVAQISAGYYHTCVLRGATPSTRQVVCWGESSNGALGIGGPLEDPVTLADAANAVDLAGLTPVTLMAGGSSTCVRLEGGQVLCWGNNSSNGLGGAGTNWAPDAEQHLLTFENGTDHLVTSERSSRHCVFKAPTDLYCWGSNAAGAVGTPLLLDEPIRSPTKIQIGDRRFVDFQLGGGSGCVLGEEGGVYCFGDNNVAGYAGAYDPALHPSENWDRRPNGGAVDLGDFDGELGIDPVARLFLATVPCAMMRDRSIRCWGSPTTWGKVGYGLELSEETLTALGDLGDDETPAQVYALVGRPEVRLW